MDRAAPMQKRSAVKEAIRELLASGPHTRKQLKRLTGASAGSITKRLSDLRAEVGVIHFRRDGEDWFQLPTPAITKFESRKQQNKGLKEELSNVVFDLIIGPSTQPEDADLQVPTENDVLSLVNRETRTNLLSIYASRDRTVILDGTTTNYYLAERLKSLSLPSEQHHLWRLLVVTNSPPIAECLYEATAGPDVAIIGGRISRDTRAISGHLAQAALREWDIEADFSIVGAAGLNLPRGFCNFSEDEAAVKTQLLSRARVKCIAMDSSKITDFSAGRAGMTFCFAPASKTAIDLVISDSGVWKHTSFCDELKGRGICLLAPCQEA